MWVVLSGNEAVARGAWQFGVRFAAAYPGTPSTEILEALLAYPDLHAQWSVNEKVAFDEALGASMGGARALVAMKHVGLNVAADSLLTAAYVGVGGGFVVVSCDDPGMHSSQNEQDNRNYAAFAKIPMLEPADSRECLEFVGRALDLSEQFDTPVLLRLTTRISHTRCVVETNDCRMPVETKAFEKNPEKYVMVPAYARERHRIVEDRLERLARFSEETNLNRAEPGERPFGLIASGLCYQYAREAFPDAPIFKLGLSYPLPLEQLRAFVESVESAYVVEELDPFIEERMLAAAIPVSGKNLLSRCGEYTPTAIRRAIAEDLGLPPAEPKAGLRKPIADLPPRPPVLCPGCPHRGVFYVLKQLGVHVTGDIGCYTLSVLPPLLAVDSCICMGASVGMGFGLDKMSEPGRTVAVIGDSTFLHSGIPPLIDMAWNQSGGVLVILDNRTVAMTGRQPTAASSHTGGPDADSAGGEPPVDLVRLCKAAGVEDVIVVDPCDLEQVFATLRRALDSNRPSVIIADRPCGLLKTAERRAPMSVDADLCDGCMTCANLACPAMVAKDGRTEVVADLCRGCALCRQVCESDAVAVSGTSKTKRTQ